MILLDPGTMVALILSGLLIGLISALVGIGGGVITVPILIFGFGLDTPVASTISVFVIIFTSSSSAYTHYKMKRIDMRTGLIFASIVVPSAFIGGYISGIIEAEILTIIFGLLMIVVALRKITSVLKIQKSKNSKNSSNSSKKLSDIDPTLKYGLIPQKIEQRLITDKDGEQFRYQVNLRTTLIGAAIGGFVGALLGAGAGIIFVPLLNSVGGVPPHIAVATSSFVIIFSALSGSLSRILFSELPPEIWSYIPLLAIGTVTGARISASKVKKISSEKLLILFYTIVLVSGVRTILKGLGIF